jgi:hypothetical protein
VELPKTLISPKNPSLSPAMSVPYCRAVPLLIVTQPQRSVLVSSVPAPTMSCVEAVPPLAGGIGVTTPVVVMAAGAMPAETLATRSATSAMIRRGRNGIRQAVMKFEPLDRGASDSAPVGFSRELPSGARHSSDAIASRTRRTTAGGNTSGDGAIAVRVLVPNRNDASVHAGRISRRLPAKSACESGLDAARSAKCASFCRIGKRYGGRFATRASFV